MRLKNIILGIKDQLPLKRLLRNIITTKIFGILSKRSHYRDNGEPKICYGSKKSAIKASERMAKKKGYHFSNYKCFYCDGYHIGAHRYQMAIEESKKDIDTNV